MMENDELNKDTPMDDATIDEKRAYFSTPLSEGEREAIRFMVRYLITAVILIIIAGTIVGIIVSVI